MIISHSQKFIFVKTRKTAGTSLEMVLSKACKPGDVVTAISPDDEVDRGPIEAKVGDFEALDPSRRIFNHASIENALRVFGERILDYAVVSAERNPFDRVVSWFYWRQRGAKALQDAVLRAEFKKFLLDELPLVQDCPEPYCVGGSTVVDFMIRFENLESDFEKVCSALSLPATNLDKSAKSGYRPASSRANPESLFDEEAYAIVRNRFPYQLSVLGYGEPGRSCPEFVPLKTRRRSKLTFLEGLGA